jgi:hypothetical protein
MKRRTFCKSTGAAGITAGLAPFLNSCSGSRQQDEIRYIDTNPGIGVLQSIENEELKVTMYSNAVLDIIDKPNGMKWQTGKVAAQEYGIIEEDVVWTRRERTYMEQYPGRFSGEMIGDTIRFKLLSRHNQYIGSFVCKISLENRFLRVQVLEVDDTIPSLTFPAPVFSDAYIVPRGAGELLAPEFSGLGDRWLNVPHSSMNMQCFGGLKEGHAWLGIFDEDVVDYGVMTVNGMAYPCWMRSLGKWNSKYEVKYCFFRGGYVEAAKTYRRYLQEKGKIKTIDEKISANPLLAKMKGGRALSYFEGWPGFKTEALEDVMFKPEHIAKARLKFEVDYTHEDVLKSLAYVRGLGFDKGLVMIRGWIQNGYDGSHPDIWPPDERLGSIDKLKEILALDDGAVHGLHDEYISIYDGRPSYPVGLIKRASQEIIPGGVWAGGQAYVLNSRFSLQYARRNWENTRTLEPKALFCDTTAFTQLKQSFDRQYPETKLDDKLGKIELMKFFKSNGLLLGSEDGSEFAIPYCDWFESRHDRLPTGETIPFWQLVFHDCVFMSRYLSFDRSTPYPQWLTDMLWGLQLHFFVPPSFGNIRAGGRNEITGFGATSFTLEDFMKTRFVDQWHERVGSAEMTGHRFLTPDRQVEETSWSTGEKIIVNFSDHPATIDNKVIKARDYRLLM